MGPKWPLAYLTDRGAMSYDPGNEEINRMVGDLRLRDAICPLESYDSPKTRARARKTLATCNEMRWQQARHGGNFGGNSESLNLETLTVQGFPAIVQ